MELIISGIHKKFFPLWLAVITVCHHQIPVNIFLHGIFRNRKGIAALSYIFNNGSTDPCLFPHLAERSIFILFALLYGSLGQYPSFVSVPVIFVKNQYLSPKDYHTTTACCFDHCNSS